MRSALHNTSIHQTPSTYSRIIYIVAVDRKIINQDSNPRDFLIQYISPLTSRNLDIPGAQVNWNIHTPEPSAFQPQLPGTLVILFTILGRVRFWDQRQSESL